jgi:hypothetical protein
VRTVSTDAPAIRSTWAAAWPSLRLDAAICVACAVLLVLMSLNPEGSHAWTLAGTLLAPAAALPVLAWRRAALVAAGAMPAGVLISGLPTLDQTRCGVVIPIALLVAFSAGMRLPGRPALLALALILGAMAILLVTDPLLDAEAVPILLLPALALGAGAAVRVQTALARRLARRTVELEERRARVAAIAAEVARGRVSVDLERSAHRRVAALAAAARDAEAHPSPGACADIEAEGRAALNEMRALLGALRSDDAGAPAATGQRLADAVGPSGAGRRVEVAVRGSPRELPEAVDRAAARAVGYLVDAMSAGAIVMSYEDEAVTIDVNGLSAGRDAAAVAVAAAGARAAAHGGSLESAPGTERLAVRIRLPIAGAANA